MKWPRIGSLVFWGSLILVLLVPDLWGFWAREVERTEFVALAIARRVIEVELREPDMGGSRARDQLRDTYDLLAGKDLDLDALAGPEPGRARTRRAWRDAQETLAERAALRRLGSWALVRVSTGSRWPLPSAEARPFLEPPDGGIPAEGLCFFVRSEEGSIAQVCWTLLPRDLEDAYDWALVEWMIVGSEAWQERVTALEARLGWPPGTITLQELRPGAGGERTDDLESVGTLESTKGVTLAHLRVPASFFVTWTEREPGLPGWLLRALTALWILGIIAWAIRGDSIATLTQRVARAAEAGHVVEPLGRGLGSVAALGRMIERAFAALSQEQLFRADAERRAAWEEVARRVAHEIKNPLTPIRLAVDNLQRAASRGDDALKASLPEESAAIREEVRRLERLVNEFHEFARLPVPTFASVEVVPALREALEGQLGASGSVTLRIDVVEDPPPLHADPDLLRMAFANLGRNAVRAMGEDGGELRARVDLVDRGAQLMITLEDEGPGLPDEILERAFEPYVTGHESGTGLGLAITRRIIAGHGGRIVAERSPGGGALFRIHLPLRRSSAPIQA